MNQDPAIQNMRIARPQPLSADHSQSADLHTHRELHTQGFADGTAYTITNAVGATVINGTLQEYAPLNVKDLPSRMYFLRARTKASETLSFPFVKQ